MLVALIMAWIQLHPVMGVPHPRDRTIWQIESRTTLDLQTRPIRCSPALKGTRILPPARHIRLISLRTGIGRAADTLRLDKNRAVECSLQGTPLDPYYV